MMNRKGIEMALSIIAVVFSCLLLGSHFLRSGHPLFTLLCVFLPFLLLIKRRWILLMVQLFMYAGGLIWIHTAIHVMRKRIIMGLPWSKPVIILGLVAGFTIFSGLLLHVKGVKERYPKKISKIMNM
ncbi:MAG: hypothetical protein ACMUIA_07225 [bacterium]